MIDVDLVAQSIVRIGTAGAVLDESQLADVLIACGWEPAEPALASPPKKFVRDQLVAVILADGGAPFVEFDFRIIEKGADDFDAAVENGHAQQVVEMQEIRSRLLASVRRASSGRLDPALQEDLVIETVVGFVWCEVYQIGSMYVAVGVEHTEWDFTPIVLLARIRQELPDWVVEFDQDSVWDD